MLKQFQIECGNANPKGNVALTYKGGCGKKLDTTKAYRCTGCGGWFHKECILKHFELEKDHDYGRKAEIDRIRKVVEGKKKVIPKSINMTPFPDDLIKAFRVKEQGYNQAIDDILKDLCQEQNTTKRTNIK